MNPREIYFLKEPQREAKPLIECKAVFFDMDGTLIAGQNTWRALFEKKGGLNENVEMKSKFLRGEYHTYMDWTNAKCEWLKQHGLTKSEFEEVINNQPITIGAKGAISALNERGCKTFIISGGSVALVERLKKELGFDEVVAHCELIFDKGRKLDTWKLTPSDREDKVTVFNRLISKYGIKPLECAYVGDAENDKEVFDIVGAPIIFNSKKKGDLVTSAFLSSDEHDLRLALKSIGLIH